MSRDDHTIRIVFGIVQGVPYDEFPKITHTIKILKNKQLVNGIKDHLQLPIANKR
jgi:radical SAM superfamily enzyme